MEGAYYTTTSTNNDRGYPAVWEPAVELEEIAPRGIYNIGNTCFMNAALQCMGSVMPLTSYLLGSSWLKGRHVAQSYSSFLSEIWSESETCDKGVIPSRLLHAIRTTHPIFRGFQQHDTQEFLRLFMDTLAEETRIPYFYMEDVKETKSQKSVEPDSSDSETESFETCDSGNVSEEALCNDVHAGCGDMAENCDMKTFKHVKKELKIQMKSIVSDIFDGKIESSVQCLFCKQTSSRLEVFQDLSLPIPSKEELLSLRSEAERVDESQSSSNITDYFYVFSMIWGWLKSIFWGPTPTLEDCFSAFFSSDELKGKNMYSCEKCAKLRNGLKRCLLYQLPEVLCVHLKRFRMYDYSGGMGFSGKVSQYVQFPIEEMELKPFLHKDCSSKVTKYRLLGVISHIGSFLGGHYTAYVRRGEQWFLCDDSRIVPVSEETVADTEAYVLFYQKSDSNNEDNVKFQNYIRHCWQEKEKEKEAMLDADNGVNHSKLHLLSKKWLSQFIWNEEVGPIDNSDVVCPHGFLVPTEIRHLTRTSVPSVVWDRLEERFGGGPDLVHFESCRICLSGWRKFQKINKIKEY